MLFDDGIVAYLTGPDTVYVDGVLQPRCPNPDCPSNAPPESGVRWRDPDDER
jgi:hypothetical protein